MGEMQGRGARCGAIARRVTGAAALWVALAASSQAQEERSYATQPFTPQNFRMPEGEGCAGDVARWKAVQENDYVSGNIGLTIYHQIQGEIARAAAACQAGHDGEARALVHASKARHGYPG